MCVLGNFTLPKTAEIQRKCVPVPSEGVNINKQSHQYTLAWEGTWQLCAHTSLDSFIHYV